MSAYFIFNLDVHDRDIYERYREAISKEHLPSRYGGRYLVLAGPYEIVEGDYDPKRIVIIEFPSVEKAKEWYACVEYQAAKEFRVASAHTNVILVESGASWPPAGPSR